jgi:drug/metabolite transporter (DMT)-like permease
VLGEAVTSSLVLGGILVILGVWLVERRQNRLWGWLVRRGTA